MLKYITDDDLTTESYQRFITESSGDGEDVIEKCEERAIALVTAYISNRYSIKDIFGVETGRDLPDEEEDPDWEIPPLRNELLAEIITKITLYRLFRRNAARKLPEDIKEDYEWALKTLEKIQTGRILLELPPAMDEGGMARSNAIWGNNSNSDFYI